MKTPVAEGNELERGDNEHQGLPSRSFPEKYRSSTHDIEWWNNNVEQMQDFMDSQSNQRNCVYLTAIEILRLRAEKKLRLPPIYEDDINDNSKSDAFAKAIAIGQILWNTIQIIARAIQHLPISQLELAVLAYSACAVVIYGLNWNKPKGPQVPCILLRYEKSIPKEILNYLHNSFINPSFILYEAFL